MKFCSPLFFCLLTLLFTQNLFATHNFGGEITYRKLDAFTVEATITTYTKASSVNADRDSLILCWGDGVCTTVSRVNGPNHEGEIVLGDTKMNRYVGVHSYASAAVYTISMTDPNRNAGIINVNSPNSETVSFHLQATVDLTPAGAFSWSSPVLLELPIDYAFQGQPYLHAPNAFDADGDSLAYELVVPMQETDEAVPNYFFPTDIFPGPGNQLTLDPETGLLSWDAPQAAGAYVIAIQVKAYRNGQLVEVISRDMLIEVFSLQNTPPGLTMDLPQDQVIVVQPGDTVLVQIAANDSDPGQALTLSVSNGLDAAFQSFVVSPTSPAAVDGFFRWVVQASQVREQPYQVVFKARDNALQNNSVELGGAATFTLLRFQVQQAVALQPEPLAPPSLRVFPNPAQAAAFLVEWPDASAGEARAYLLDGLGRTCRSLEVPAAAQRLRIAVDGLPAGWYTVGIFLPGHAPGYVKVLVP